MIKVLKLQKAVISFILGILALIVYIIMSSNKIESSSYVLTLAGLLFIAGSLMAIYPILFGKKDKKGKVELDPEKRVAMEQEPEGATS
ncbi:MAG: isoleucyl-tRNA synthetase [Pedobacter sp.]|nr:isoleucyl-tRNA synthetase [Pedobacter sp.]